MILKKDGSFTTQNSMNMVTGPAVTGITISLIEIVSEPLKLIKIHPKV